MKSQPGFQAMHKKKMAGPSMDKVHTILIKDVHPENWPLTAYHPFVSSAGPAWVPRRRSRSLPRNQAELRAALMIPKEQRIINFSYTSLRGEFTSAVSKARYLVIAYC